MSIELLKTTLKEELHPKKVMLCIWWNCQGVVHFELLPENHTIDSDKYCAQLADLKAVIRKHAGE